MMYKDAKTYLNEEFRKPIKILLEKGGTNDVMKFIDALCNKYLEVNECALMYEKLLTEEQLKTFRAVDVMNELEEAKCRDFDKLDSPYTEEERATLTGCISSPSYHFCVNEKGDIVVSFIGNGDGNGNGAGAGSNIRIGDFIRLMRKDVKMKQNELASLCGVTKQNINYIEHNKNKPNVVLFIRIMSALGEKNGYKLVAKA